jgi:hypothetical protein
MTSLNELEILKSLSTLQHKHLTMTKPYLDYIFGRGGFTCSVAIHSGLTCRKYLLGKLISTFKDSLKLQFFAYLLPNLVMRRKQLKENF